MVAKALVLSTEIMVAAPSASYSLLSSVMPLTFTPVLFLFTKFLDELQDTDHVVTFSIKRTVRWKHHLLVCCVINLQCE